ncbi:hypothetical protein [Enorma burkinafasonensis]|uniref:hypothetical protein n=1 Tax=Enorma burkinafasonensis TaxID=2590867 RepID=UPI0011A860AD|nr:hypothetical protein [Enorma burkinafasonensis]
MVDDNELEPEAGGQTELAAAGATQAMPRLADPEPDVPREPDRRRKPSRLSVERWRLVVVVALIAVALVSAFPLRDIFSDPDTYLHTIQQLDEKRDTVLGLTAAAAASSVAITAIPDDVGTPVAEKLMDLSGDLLVVVTAIYIEKYLLTVFGWATFGLFVPLACAFVIAGILLNDTSRLRGRLYALAAKIALMGLVLVVTVPISVFVTDFIDHTYSTSLQLQEISQDQVSEEESGDGEEEEPAGSWWEQGLEFLGNLPSILGSAATSVADSVLRQVGNLIDGFAVMIVTSCVVPLGVLAFLLWAANLITGISVEVPMRVLGPRSLGGRGGSGDRPRREGKRTSSQTPAGDR